ncbi:MAG: hypothetical protein PHN69_04585 [Candidatus Pacebacteria bacterium]|nr:hypothetical protein [Fermentimonas sp.]MDD4804431.1 hypothetical protein [Candidatus Paceibacterota bacterium]
MFGYEDLTLQELYEERVRLGEFPRDTHDALSVYREVREAELEWRITEKGGKWMNTYHVEFTGTVDIEGTSAKEVLQKLKLNVFGDNNIDIESIIISKK